MRNENRTQIIGRTWDKAAEQCAAAIEAEPNIKELRDLVYILEHLNNMLDDSPNAPERLEVILAAGDEDWNL